MERSLVAENVFYSVGSKEIVRGATIRADRGGVTGLLGRNGSGKSSLLQCVFGTRKASECDVFFNGKKIKSAYTVDGLVNYLPQRPFLPGNILIGDMLKDFGVERDVLLGYFPELEDELGRRVSELSGGRERLISVLLIVLADTLFNFLDEPFSHIMPIHVDRLKELILFKKKDKGFIVTDHMYGHLLDVSDKVYLLRDGQSILINGVEDLGVYGYINSAI